MLSIITDRLPSIAAAHLRSPAAFPAISVAASKVATTFLARPHLQSRTKSAASTTPAIHDESSAFDSFYLHNAKQSAGLLHPCEDVQPERFFPEEQMVANSSQPLPFRDYRQEKVCPHSDLTHLEDPYHQYAYYPKLVSDLTNVSRLLCRPSRHGQGRKDVISTVSNVPKFDIVQDDAKRTVIKVDVSSYRPENVTAQIENGRILRVQGTSTTENGVNRSEAKYFAKKFILTDVDEDGVTATIEDGLLTIGLPKLGKGKSKVKNIPIV